MFDCVEKAKVQLARETASLREVLQPKRDHLQFIKELRELDLKLQRKTHFGKDFAKGAKPKKVLHASPATRSKVRAAVGLMQLAGTILSSGR